jgi:tRNA(fMet)-specific endonuclease VapC
MRRYLLDTNAMGDFINHRRGVDERAREARSGGARFGTCIPVLGELFFGIEYSQSRDRNLDRLKRALTGLACWPYTREAAEEYGRLAAQLRRAGRTIQQVDLQLAAMKAAPAGGGWPTFPVAQPPRLCANFSSDPYKMRSARPPRTVPRRRKAPMREDLRS